MNTERLEPIWINQKMIQAIHANQIRQHGGRLGLRDKGLLESALQRAPNLWHYNMEADLCDFAAAYGMGIAKNHAFIDGNKRIAFQAMYVFLGLNNFDITATEPDVITLMLGVADGTIDEEHLAQWLRDHIEPC